MGSMQHGSRSLWYDAAAGIRGVFVLVVIDIIDMIDMTADEVHVKYVASRRPVQSTKHGK